MNLESIPNNITMNYVPDEYFELKTRIHDRLLDIIDLSAIERLEPDALKSQIRVIVQRILGEEDFAAPLNSMERERLFTEIQDEVMGLGPLEPFLKDPAVS
ncbi:CpaF family protein, partial [bacterium]|nr:CpaF family protein [bacterium]